jgi:hypothetical protein
MSFPCLHIFDNRFLPCQRERTPSRQSPDAGRCAILVLPATWTGIPGALGSLSRGHISHQRRFNVASLRAAAEGTPASRSPCGLAAFRTFAKISTVLGIVSLRSPISTPATHRSDTRSQRLDSDRHNVAYRLASFRNLDVKGSESILATLLDRMQNLPETQSSN